jgi:hypothetical protein
MAQVVASRGLIRQGALSFLLVVFLTAGMLPECALAQSFPRHAVGAEYNGLIFYGSTSVNYELITSDNMSFRVGMGTSYASIIIADIEATGGTAMINFMSRGPHKLEGGIGVSVMRSNFSFIFDDEETDLGYHIFPAFSVAYRTMPKRRGFFWRVGVAWMYGYGLPLALGVGYVF